MLLPLALVLQVGAISNVAIERRFAERLGLSVGDTIQLAAEPNGFPTPFVVSAVYQPPADPATALRGEFVARLHLPDLATLLGYPDRVDRIAIGAREGVAPDSVAVRLNQLAFGYHAFRSKEIADKSSRTFLVVSRFHRAIGLIAIVASAIFLLCIMLLKVEERRIDAAVLRMIGVSRRTIVLAFVLEACLIAVVGSLVGVGLAHGAALVTNAVYQRKFETTLTFAYLTPAIVLEGMVLSIVLGVGAGLAASVRLVRINPMVLWRRA
jgi:putative ABC transport system permease protein